MRSPQITTLLQAGKMPRGKLILTRSPGWGALITADEEVELARRIKTSDQAAPEKLVKANLRFVVLVAKKYQSKVMPLSELIQSGNVGHCPHGVFKGFYGKDRPRHFKNCGGVQGSCFEITDLEEYE